MGDRRESKLNNVPGTLLAIVDLPGFRLHRLKGDRQSTWAIDVSRNWRVVFTFRGGDAFDVDYEDYH